MLDSYFTHSHLNLQGYKRKLFFLNSLLYVGMDSFKHASKSATNRDHLVRTQNSPKKTNIYPLVRTRTCAYQGVRNTE